MGDTYVIFRSLKSIVNVWIEDSAGDTTYTTSNTPPTHKVKEKAKTGDLDIKQFEVCQQSSVGKYLFWIWL